jgi:Leucine-rich repeat (LRR) protein
MNKSAEFRPAIEKLIKLRKLDLSMNEFAGAVPSQLGLLINLRTLYSDLNYRDLSRNQLTSPPSEIGRLSNLQELFP